MNRTRDIPRLARRQSVFLHRAGKPSGVVRLASGKGPPATLPFIQRYGGSILKACQYVCSILALICLGYAAVSYGHGRIFQAYQSWRFDRALHRQPVAKAVAPSAPTPPDRRLAASRPKIGSVLGRLEIPRLDLSVMVLEGDDDAVLRNGAGHVPSTALPGGAGNVVVAAHRDTFFRPLRKISKGDEITFTTTQGVERYRVKSIREVDPHDVQVLKPLNHPTLTLITCYPFYFVGDAPKRFVVQAALSTSGN